MSTTQTFLWTVLLNSVQPDDAQRLRLSVFVSPRLRSDEGTTLDLFPDFLDWAARMQHDQVSFTLNVGDGTQIQATIVSAPPDVTLWRALFTRDIPVRPYQFDDFSRRPIVSFPVSSILDYLKKAYQTVASAAPFELPRSVLGEDSDSRADILAAIFRPLVLLHQDRGLMKNIDASLEGARSRAQQGQPSGPIEPDGMAGLGSTSDAFYRSMLFHYRPSAAQPVDLPEGEQARARFEDEFDFHQMLSALGDFPQLHRRLGLIFDLTIPADALPQNRNEFAPGKVRVIPTWTSTFPLRQSADQSTWTSDYSPWTMYHYFEVNDRRFLFVPARRGEVAAGLWVPEKNVELVQVDVDGAALKTLNLAASLARIEKSNGQRAIDAPENDGVPALRTGGISVILTRNVDVMHNAFLRSGEINRILESDPPESTDLCAEDLTRGYRLDVLEKRTDQWRSLNQRIGTYTILNAPGTVVEIADEGMIQLAVTSPVQDPAAPPDPGKELYVHESLFTWDGWSLSVPRPGKSISRSARAPTEGDADTQPRSVKNTAMTRLGLETSFVAQKGTLPRLRFGGQYRLRVRAVDLAGNGPTLEEATAVEAALPNLKTRLPQDKDLLYCRFEPVPPPELVPRQLYSPDGDTDSAMVSGYADGESLERLVIRSNFDRSTEEYAAAHPVYRPDNERHVAAPKASLQLIEAHGLLDAAFDAPHGGLNPDEVRARIQSIYDLALREAGSLNDTVLPTVRFIRTGSDADSTEGYCVHTEEQLVLPYLPDPWATGVVLRGLPGMPPDTPMKIEWGDPIWHQAPPFRLRLAEGTDAPAWDAAARILTVRLPKAGIARVRISSLFGGAIDVMGIWQWLREAAGNGDIGDDQMRELTAGIEESRHWMFTPFRDLTLVHAVQQPLRQPGVNLKVSRSQDSTAAFLFGDIELHAQSTAKVDILADWNEPRNDPASAGPDAVDVRAHVMELPVTLDGQAIRLEYPEFEDALRVQDDKLLVFHCAQANILRQRIQARLNQAIPPLSPKQRRSLEDDLRLADKVVPHEFGDTKYRRVRYRVSATSRFREYFAAGITVDADNLTRISEAVEIDVLSSARPAPPLVRYVLPTFGWEQATEEGGEVTSRRHGAGVRIYLDQTWHSSGAGEMLGIVLGQLVPERRDPLYNYSTFWGQDPVWASPGLTSPKARNFKGNKGVYQTVQLADLDNHPFVTVIGYDVEWDKERKLWFCDVELDDVDAYYLFIRLALARYQPNSLVAPSDAPPSLDLRLSPVVLADFVQTAPERAVTITRDPNVQGTYAVAIRGKTYTAQRALDGAVVATNSQVDVMVQRRVAEIEDQTLGWTDLPLSVSLAPGAADEDGVVTWQGQVSIAPANQAEQLRLVIREYESLLVAAAPGTAPPAGRRVVYVDTIPL